MKRFIISNWMLLVFYTVLSLLMFILLSLYEETITPFALSSNRECSKAKKVGNKVVGIKQYSPFCGPYTLGKIEATSERQMTKKHNDSHSCRISSMDKLICEDIKDMFYRYTADDKCPMKSTFEFCKLTNKQNFDRRNLKSMVFSCDLCPCDSDSPFSIGFTDPETGLHSWIHLSIPQNIEKQVQREAIKTLNAGNPYLFFRCSSKKTLDFIVQLLVLPFVPVGPNRVQSIPVNKQRKKPFININMILIDSVSRPHFYRSLPRTVEYLTKLRHSYKQWVFDFERFHSIKARTFESLHALFTGEILQLGSEFEGVAIPPQAVGFRKLLEKFKERNFDTLYQEDLCWEHYWGLIRDTGIFKENIALRKRFSAFNNVLSRNFIENLGVTHSSCEIFHSHNIIDNFNGPKKVCYGGRLQHDFFLEYLLDAIKSKKEKQLFSFAVLNVGHEGTGRRIRTFDESLMSFLTELEDQEDIVNILFSDHGNNYGLFSATSEGRFEMFHPFLFMIVPHLIAEEIGDVKMRNLVANQKRLFTLVDVHHTLVGLLKVFQQNNVNSDEDTHVKAIFEGEVKKNDSETSRLGLLGRISSKRGCDDLSLLRGTLCYCEGWKTKLPVSSLHFLIAEFAFAKLNKLIIQSQMKKRLKPESPTQQKNFCQLLQGYSVKNVWQRRKRLKVLFGMDITTQQSSVFSIVVSAKIDTPKFLELDSVERLTRYGQYRNCAHPDVELKMCICQQKGSTRDDSNRFPGSALGSMFGVKTVSRLIHFPCFYILSRTYKSGVVFEASNACWNISYTVDVSFQLTNLRLAQEIGKTKVPAGSVRHLAILIMSEAGFEWRWQYSIDLTWTKIQRNLRTRSNRKRLLGVSVIV